VIKYGGAAMARDGLKRSFCDDVLLLRSVGLAPIVVHGGGPELAAALDQLGGQLGGQPGGDPAGGAHTDGASRATSAAALRVVETVTGAINAELVTILNRGGAHAVGLSGKDAALLRVRKPGPGDRALGLAGPAATPGAPAGDPVDVDVNRGFLESLIGQNYIPVVSPVGLGPDGGSYHLDADVVAAGIARALGADKLMYLADVAGIVEAGELVTDLTPATLGGKLAAGAITGELAIKAVAALAALAGGVHAVHLIDGRIPHNLIAELFTDTGVGTIIRGDA
jgi:acetylglutamate kinase